MSSQLPKPTTTQGLPRPSLSNQTTAGTRNTPPSSPKPPVITDYASL
ncbi:MAG: hypothetical protein WBC93_18735 [Sulfitobacter sp.]